MKYLNLIAFGLMVYMNYLANALPINGKTTGQLSAQYPNLFVPAGITFSIWGVIYLMLLVFVIMQFKVQNKPLIASIGWLFAISCVLNAAWIVAWHYEQLPLSLLIMLGLLATLVIINLNIMKFPALFPRATFGIYLGWICIATIANVTALLVSYQWGGWGISDQSWAIIMITAGALISMAVIYKLENPFVALAVIWAFVGIILNRVNDFPAIVTAASIGIVLTAIVAVVKAFKL